jgi:hypothetical protein
MYPFMASYYNKITNYVSEGRRKGSICVVRYSEIIEGICCVCYFLQTQANMCKKMINGHPREGNVPAIFSDPQ